MDVLFRLGRATAAEVRAELADPPSYSAVRAQLRTLEEKGHLKHQEQGLRYVYIPKVRPDQARRSAIRHLLDTFFEGSAVQAASALLDSESAQLSTEELDQLEQLIVQSRERKNSNAE